MTIYLIPNLTKPQAASTAAAAVDVLCAQGAQVILPADVPQQPLRAGLLRFWRRPAPFPAAMPSSPSAGTAPFCMPRGAASGSTSLLGVNIGRMGFLATVEAYELDKLPMEKVHYEKF